MNINKLTDVVASHLKDDLIENPEYWAKMIVTTFWKRDPKTLIAFLDLDNLIPSRRAEIIEELGFDPRKAEHTPEEEEAINKTSHHYDPKLLEWFPPLWEDQRTLREVYTELMSFGNDQSEVPLIVRLVENPEFHFSGFGFFKGRVTLQQHDFIHIILGRGTMLADEAFVLGFTMGTTDRVSPLEENLFSFINDIFYPKAYRFTKIGHRIFKEAISLGYISDCEVLETTNFEPMLDWSLQKIREELGLEKDLLQAYYNVEARRHPKSRASQRIARL